MEKLSKRTGPLVSEGFSSEAAQTAFDTFNKQLKRDPEGLKRVIAYIEPGYYGPHQEADQDAADAVRGVLREADNGTGIGTDDRIWTEIFEDPEHNTALASLRTIQKELLHLRRSGGSKEQVTRKTKEEEAARRSLGCATLLFFTKYSKIVTDTFIIEQPEKEVSDSSTLVSV